MVSPIIMKSLTIFGILFLCLRLFVLAATGSGNPPSPSSSPNTGITYECNAGKPGDCTFDDLILAVKRLTDWGALFAIAFSVIVIAWAGFNYMISGDNAGKRTAANKMMFSVVKGLAFILAAWLIVTLITNGLGVTVNTFLS